MCSPRDWDIKDSHAMQTAEKPISNDTKAVRGARPAPSRDLRRMRGVAVLTFFLGAGVGGAIGAVVTHQHYHVRNVVAAVNGTEIDKDYLFAKLDQTAGDATMRQI